VMTTVTKSLCVFCFCCIIVYPYVCLPLLNLCFLSLCMYCAVYFMYNFSLGCVSEKKNDITLKEYVTTLASKYPKYLTVCHINAQSLHDSVHQDEFGEIFSNGDMDVVGVSETFFKNNDCLDLDN